MAVEKALSMAAVMDLADEVREAYITKLNRNNEYTRKHGGDGKA